MVSTNPPKVVISKIIPHSGLERSEKNKTTLSFFTWPRLVHVKINAMATIFIPKLFVDRKQKTCFFSGLSNLSTEGFEKKTLLLQFCDKT